MTTPTAASPSRDTSKDLLRGMLRSLRATKRAIAPSLEIADLPVVRPLLQFLIRQSRSDFVADVEGHKMFVGRNDNLNLSSYGTYEPCETKFFAEKVQPGQVVVDIGANIGYYTLQFARAVGPAGHVYAFEPEAENFELLQRNVALNRYSNVTLVNKAVSDTTGSLRFYVSENAAAHSVSDSHGATEFVDVPCLRLDEYFAGQNRAIDIIKMDVEGAELHAVEGMADLLCRNASLMMVTEFWPKGFSHAGSDAAAYLQRMRELGFTIYLLNENTQKLELASDAALLGQFTVGNGHHCNLVFSRKGLPVPV